MISKLLRFSYVIVAGCLLFAQYSTATPTDDFLSALSSFGYFSSASVEPELSSDGKTLYNATLPAVYVVNPDPSHQRVQIPESFDLLTAPESVTATFSIAYVPNGGTDIWGHLCSAFPAQAQTPFNAAANIWAKAIQSSVPITIRACWANLGSSGILGGSGGMPLQRDFTGAPLSSTWYAGSLANALAGYDLGVNTFDMHITYNSNASWYYGTDGLTPTGQYDLMSVVLHEIAHGLNFSGSMSYSAGSGSWGYSTGYPNIYDTFMRDGSGNQLINTSVYPNPSTALGTALTSNNIWFHGSNAMAANGGVKVKMYAPSTWASGSSYSHLDYATFNNTVNQLMVYAISDGESVHDPGAVTKGLLKDLGWNLLPDLIETTVSDPPASSPAGSSFSVTDTVKNQGGGSAGASITSYYLSSDTIKGSGDILLTGSRSVPSLGINETNSGILTVTIPSGTESGSYYLLACADDANVVGESDENNNCISSVSQVNVVPIISIISPNGGEALTAGSAYTIQWTYGGNPGTAVKIELLKGGIPTATISYYTSIGSAGSGSFNWSIPSNQVSGSDYQIKVTSTTNAAYSDISDSTFIIVGPPPPTISVTSPNGGETLTAGSAYTIQWTYGGNPGTAVKIELLKGGIPTATISYYTSIGSAGSGSFNWSIPSAQVSGTDYQIKVTSTTNAAYSDISDIVFSIVGPPPPTISVTSPNGGESLTAGSAQTIRWSYGGNPGSAVKIELLKGGVLTATISYYTSIGSAGSGSFNWSIPSNQVSGSDYQIKVTSTTNAVYSDISDTTFTIVGPPPPTISVTSPNGGETLTAGSAQTIRWNYIGNPGSAVKIELLKGGVSVSTISYYTSIGSAGSGSFNWSIPSTQASGSDYQIKVTSTSNATYSDISDSNFTIVGPPPPTISVTSPNGGETLTAGSMQTIRWSYGGNPGSAVKIELLKGGVSVSTISYYTSIGSAGSGFFNWSIPSTQASGSDYQIKVTSATNAAYSDISDSVFSIVGPPPPTISVTSPNGGETLTAGLAQTIQWSYGGNPGSGVKIELLKGGVLTTTISYYTSIGSAGGGSFNWSIPSAQVSGTDYQIKVTSTTNAAYSDISDSVFTIVGPPPPTISVTSPNGGETLTAGSVYTIRWSYTGNSGSAVKIELLKGGMVTATISYFTSIGSAGSGSYNWSIPSNQVSGSDYQIKVTSATNSAYTDTSDSNFTIQ